MIFHRARGFIVRLVSLALVSAGLAQASVAGVVGTGYLVDAEARSESSLRIEAFLARADVARQLQAFGVDKATIEARIAGLTPAELLALEARIDSDVAGGDALAIIGAVFLVLLILELVGVTDVFSKL